MYDKQFQQHFIILKIQQSNNFKFCQQQSTGPSIMKILKFRSFVSKEQEGFVVIFNQPIPELIFEDILYQLFQPIFYDSICPQIFYFSTTDQILNYEQMTNAKTYIYVHFLQRVRQYQQSYDKYGFEKSDNKISHKFKLGNIDELGRGINFQGSNIYIFSEVSYEMYGRQVFKNMIEKKIVALTNKFSLKENAYREYMGELEHVKKNDDFLELKQQIDAANNQINDKIGKLDDVTTRYSKAKTTLKTILRASGIEIRGVKDLF